MHSASTNINSVMALFLCLASATLGCSNTTHAASQKHPAPPDMAYIPGGFFEMGDHSGFVDPKHGGDETPIHSVRLNPFYMGIFDVTTQEYCVFLNKALAQQSIAVRQGGVYPAQGDELFCETRGMSPYSRIGWDGAQFSVLNGKENHPIVCIRWAGAAAYCNWLSAQAGAPLCYTPGTWACDLHKAGYRLPTEAEWEYAARGGQCQPYQNFPWGDTPDARKANWPESDNPFREGPWPWTTPAGFFNGSLQQKSSFGWPGFQATYQTANGVNGYGLYDMSGNVWQLINDWYGRDYYGQSPAENPPGPSQGSVMPDGKPYRGMRGGNWYNGEHGHGRVSNRNPSYWRGPQDPDHPYYHVGFRIVLPIAPEDAAPSEQPPNQPNRPAPAPAPGSALALTSPAVANGGTLPAEYTGDGEAATLPLAWSGAPPNTQSFAIIMHHIAPDMTKCYWILYNIPAQVQQLPKNAHDIGTPGINSINGRREYAPPHSKGPGPKTYIYTLYALSAPPPLNLPPERIDRNTLLDAMQGRILGQAELQVVYTRQNQTQVNRPPFLNPQEAKETQEAQDPQAEDRQAILESLGYLAPDPQLPPVARNEPRAHAENHPPRSPNPGQTIGLFLDSPQAFTGYTLFAPKHNTVTYLIDNQGRIVHQWKSQYEPGQSVYLKPNGNLMHCCFTHNRGFTGGGEGGRIEEFDWAGNLVWAFEFSNDEHLSHHDIAIMPNGHILMLVVEKKSIADCIAAGFNPAMLIDRQLFPDSIVEIQPIYPNGGRIVWEWHVWDHLIQDFDATKANYGPVTEHPERINVHCNGRKAPAFWNHMNAIDYNPALDQIMLSVRGCNEIWIVDHSTTIQEAAGHTGGKHGKGGDLIYRWGNPAAYGLGTEQDRQLWDQHDARWIPEGFPGAGHITIFNNGYARGWSSIEEIAPPIDAKGRYAYTSGQPYGPAKPVWHYEAQDRSRFFSSEISGAQRLPNGNTLICEGVIGNLFEVSPAGETVWQYVNPMVRGGILAQGELPGKDVRGHLFNAVFKVQRYALDYPGLAGRDLTPQGLIELPAAQKGKTGLDQQNAPPGERPGPQRPGMGPRQPPPSPPPPPPQRW